MTAIDRDRPWETPLPSPAHFLHGHDNLTLLGRRALLWEPAGQSRKVPARRQANPPRHGASSSRPGQPGRHSVPARWTSLITLLAVHTHD